MVENYKNVDEILENPGILIFKLNNINNDFFPKKRLSTKYELNDVNIIKNNIKNVFQQIAQYIEQSKEYSPEYLGHIVKNLDSRYNNKAKFNFPGLQVINMDREKLNFFTHYPKRFLLCEKSDGVRYLLIQYTNGICHLVGRNLEFFEIYVSEKLPPSQIKGDWTIDYLLDGELILDDFNEELDNDKSKTIKFNGKYKRINFLIFDAVVIKGANIGHLPFIRRLEEFSKIFINEYDISKYIKNCAQSFVNKMREELKLIKSLNNNKSVDFPNPGKIEKNIKNLIPGTVQTNSVNNKSISLYMKDYFNFNQVNKLNEFIQLLPHHNDGLIINVDDYPYYSGQSCEIFKWKPIKMNTIDYEIKYNKENDRYILCVFDNNKLKNNKESLVPVEILCFKSDEDKNNFRKIYNKYSSKLIAECSYDPDLCSEEVAINNYYLSKNAISMSLEDFPTDINIDKEKYKGGWIFDRLRNDKSSGNAINTYQNIKVCIKENLDMGEILSTLEKNRNIIMDQNNEEGKSYLEELKKEKNFMSALVWKKFFKANKKQDDDDFDDNSFFGKDEKKKDDNQLLNKKRKKSDDSEKDIQEKENVDDRNERNNDDDDLDDDNDNMDNLYDDDYGDDFY